jgi:hypothetical protein
MYGTFLSSSVPTSSTRATCCVLDLGGGTSFTPEALGTVGVAGKLRVQELDRYRLFQLDVPGAHDDAHCAGAEHALHAVLASELITGFQRRLPLIARVVQARVSRRSHQCPRSQGCAEYPTLGSAEDNREPTGKLNISAGPVRTYQSGARPLRAALRRNGWCGGWLAVTR